MHLRKARLVAVSTALLATAPASGVLAQPAAAESAPEAEPVVISLTDDDGERTEIATAGLEITVPGGQFAAGRTAEVGSDAVLTQPIPTEDFLVAGLTWEAGQMLAPDAQIFVRVEEDGVWSEWEETAHEEGVEGAETAAGTDPFVTGGAQTIQVRVTGDADALPDNLAITVLPTEALESPGESGAAATDVPVAEVPASSSGATGVVPEGLIGASVAASLVTTAVVPPRPAITSRAGWGADETKMTWRPTYRALKAATVHHTAGTNSYSSAQSPSVVRGIFLYHAVSRGWGDIGYNFLVDKWGRVFEGRSGSLVAPAGRMPQGAHAAPVNNGTVGISAMGDYTKVGAPAALIDSMTSVLAWQFGRAGIDARTRSGILTPGTAVTTKGTNLPRIFGHMDVSFTACPGRDIYGRLPAMRTAVARLTGHANNPNIRDLYLNNAWTPKADVEFEYGARGSQIMVGDWDGDGIDTPAARSQQVFSVRNSNTTGPADTVFAYGRPGDVVLVGDWDGDGVDTLAVRRGREYHVKNSVTSGPADQIVFYGRPDDEILVGDWNGDGTDTFAVRRGRILHVKDTMSTGVADRVIAYGRPGDTMLVGDWDGDGTDTFAVRRSTEYHIRNSLTSGVADLKLIYGRAGDGVLVGDWNGDRKDTLGVVRD